MYRILIVDDEIHIRNHLCTIINYEEICCKVVGASENAQNAMEQIRHLNPDIIICDIEMYGKNGLELAADIKQYYPEIKIIFLTGHDKFVYAQEAIHNNAIEYLLKPIDPAILKAVLEDAVKMLERQRELRHENELFREILSNSKDILRENLLKQIAFSVPDAEKEIKKKISFYDLEHDCYRAAVLEMDTFEYDENVDPEYSLQSTLYSMKNILLDKLRSEFGAYILEVDINRFLIVMMPEKDKDTLLIVENAINYIRNLFSLSLSCGISDEFISLERLQYFYYQAAKAVAHRYFIGRDSIICYSDLIDVHYSRQETPDYQSDIKNLVGSIRSGNSSQEKLESILKKTFCSSGFRLEDKGLSKAYCIEFIVMLFKTLESQSLVSMNDIAKENIYYNVMILRSTDEITVYIARVVNKLLRSNDSNNQLYYNHIVDTAIEYLRKNYASNITLNDVACAIHVNASYLSRIIKKVTGRNFVDILVQIRINHAKALLSDPARKIYEVAEIIGITDTKYFSSVFKKETGYTPTEYRNMKKF